MSFRLHYRPHKKYAAHYPFKYLGVSETGGLNYWMHSIVLNTIVIRSDSITFILSLSYNKPFICAYLLQSQTHIYDCYWIQRISLDRLLHCLKWFEMEGWSNVSWDRISRTHRRFQLRVVYAKSLTRNSVFLGCFFLNKKYESCGDDIEHQIKPNCTSNLK